MASVAVEAFETQRCEALSIGVINHNTHSIGESIF